ncbi:MAG: hypothetical protein Q4Q25_04410, partial [Methanocorpusculum sp.]|nr:hypothetical protein [Methanocorpusculum sp.]
MKNARAYLLMPVFSVVAGSWFVCPAKEPEVSSGPKNLFPNSSFEEWNEESGWPLGDGVSWRAEKLKDEVGKPLFAYFGRSDRVAHSGRMSFYVRDEHGGGYNNV